VRREGGKEGRCGEIVYLVLVMKFRIGEGDCYYKVIFVLPFGF